MFRDDIDPAQEQPQITNYKHVLDPYGMQDYGRGRTCYLGKKQTDKFMSPVSFSYS